MILHIRAVEACEVPKMDVIGKSDPYLIFKINTSSQSWKTKHKNNTDKPVWNEEFHIPITSGMSDELLVEMYDKDDISKDDLISTMTYKVNTFPVGKVTDQWYNYSPAKGVKHGGRVRLMFHLDRPGATPFKA